ncbi:hypothetical protein Bpfe_004483 [Biomphalaria pfeifferi]|uniref:Uncharacterized protein n=1 Tax=Biomphalaria pfeifferi TaxID=112525 RepID=A0AAD8FIK1_BIOPF|nr:hypothetical protein Bpfe_004483 [Biomphalaria pfeifferi]
MPGMGQLLGNFVAPSAKNKKFRLHSFMFYVVAAFSFHCCHIGEKRLWIKETQTCQQDSKILSMSGWIPFRSFREVTFLLDCMVQLIYTLYEQAHPRLLEERLLEERLLEERLWKQRRSEGAPLAAFISM